MKKSLFLLLSLALIVALCVSALADENPTLKTTELSYTISTKYTVNIPESVSILNGVGTQTVSVGANSVIPANQKLQFIITDAANYDAGFRLRNSMDMSVYLGYTITGKIGEGEAVNVSLGTAASADPPTLATNPFLEANATEAYAGKTVTLTYTTDTAQSAGIYSDSLTFTIGLADTTTP